MAITYTANQLRQICQQSSRSLMRVSKPVYSNLKQLGISHATPTHRGTTAGYQQSGVTQAIPVKVTGTRNTFPTWLIRNNARSITKLTAACNNDNLIYVKCTDDLIDSIHGQRNPHRERGLAGMGNGCFAEFCCCVPLCPCELRYSSSKDISFHRFPADKVAGRECIFKSRRDMPLL